MIRPEDDGAPEPPTDDVHRSSGDGGRVDIPPGERLPDELRLVGGHAVWSFGW